MDAQVAAKPALSEWLVFSMLFGFYLGLHTVQHPRRRLPRHAAGLPVA
jgi:hypothetical protein